MSRIQGTFNNKTKEITLNGKKIDYSTAEDMANILLDKNFDSVGMSVNERIKAITSSDWELESSSQGNAKVEEYTAAGLALIISYLVPVPLNVLFGLCAFIETIEASELEDDRIYYKRYTYISYDAPSPYPYYYKHVFKWYKDSSYSDIVATETEYEFPLLP